METFIGKFHWKDFTWKHSLESSIGKTTSDMISGFSEGSHLSILSLKEGCKVK